MKLDRLIYYRQDHNSIYTLVDLYNRICDGNTIDESQEVLFYESLSEVISESISHGYYGNLWKLYITNMLVNHENAYSLSCEMAGDAVGSISATARLDFAIIYQVFNMDFAVFKPYFDYDYDSFLCFDARNNTGYKFSKRIRDCILNLAKELSGAKDADEFQQLVAGFYKSFGVGKLGLHKAFRIEEGGQIVPVSNIAHVKLSDLVGYDIQKKQLTDNTENFLAGKKANNCLLFGDAGTGKSTSVKAICNEYYDRGLRLIEVYKHQLKDIHHVIAQIKSRKYKFIIYMDDLSFEEFETEYKYLKAVIEGGLEKKPDNVLIYATSNRRHLIKESFKDKQDMDDLHKNDTVQEKLSLAYRFGVTIYFGSPSKKEFQDIILELRDRTGITLSDDEILAEANKWEISHGGLSGRCAQQFIDYIAGQQ
ncbi:MAG: ATP-binding protein [Pseudobutyrivibrio sp.]|nr:ATP-binding protein [Pseudobutyrivibrio sp.]